VKTIAACRPGTFAFFKADLLEPSSFDVAARDGSIVFHTASPFLIGSYATLNASF
jgi:hypothetical protein